MNLNIRAMNLNIKEKAGRKNGFARLLRRISSAFNRVVSGSFIGKILTGYDKLDFRFRNCAVSSAAFYIKKLRPVGRAVSAQIESSRFVTAVNRMAHGLLTMKMRTYGWFLFSFGFYSLAVWALKVYGFALTGFSVGDVYVPISLIVVSLPLLISRETFAEAVRTNRIACFVALNVFGIRESVLDGLKGENGRNNMAFLFGLVCGALTYFLTPGTVLVILLLAILAYIIMSAPEFGVVLTFFALPLISERELLTLSGIVSISYFLKLIRGKRVIEFHVLDFAVLVFGILRVFGSTVSPLGTEGTALTEQTVSFMLMYFVTVNLIDTPKLLRRVIAAFLTSSAVSALIAITTVAFSSEWFEAAALPMLDLSKGIYSGDVSESLGFIFAAAAVYGISSLCAVEHGKKKFGALIVTLITAAAALAVGSMPVKFGLVMGILFLLILFSSKTLVIAAFAGVIYAALNSAFPSLLGGVTDGFIGAFKSGLAANSLVRKSSAALFRDVWAMGVGSDGFEAAYPLYALSGSEGAADSSSLFLNIGIELGTVGLVIFVLILFVFLQSCITHAASVYDKRERFIVFAGLSAVFAFATGGFFTNIFGDGRLFLAFWITVALTSAYKRSKSESGQGGMHLGNNHTGASVDISI